MYNINKNIAYVAISIAALSTVFCPFLKVFLVGNWNLYEVDYYLFYITIGFLALLLLLTFFSAGKLFRGLSIVYFGWCLLAIVGTYFKSNNYFGQKFADGLIAKTVSFKWGWVVLILSAIVIILSVKKQKPLIQSDEN